MDTYELEQRLSSIEKRLSGIESRLGIAERPPVIKQAAPAAGPWEYTPGATEQSLHTPSIMDSIPLSARPGSWLGIIAVICFVLAAGFIIKLSIESGWLTPERQIAIAAMFGLALIGAGFFLMESDRNYASLLPGAGVIVLYLCAFAAHRYYELVSFDAAIAMTSVISGVCIWLYMKIRHDVYPITAAAGAYASPVILGLNTGAEFSMYYFILCSLAFATISIWVKSRLLTVVAAYSALLATAMVGTHLYQDSFAATMLAAHFLIFAGGTYLYTDFTRQPLSETEAWGFFPVLLLFYVTEYFFLNRINPELAPWLSLGFAGVLVGLYITAEKSFAGKGLQSQPMILAFASIVAFHSLYLEIMPELMRPWLFIIIMLTLAFTPYKMTPAQRGRYTIPLLALKIIVVLEYLSMLYHLIDAHDSSWIIVALFSCISMWVVMLVGDDNVTRRSEYGHIWLGAAHLLAIMALFQITEGMGSLAVSVSWLLYAIGIMALAFSRQDQVMAKSALFVLSFAAGKALLYDAASAGTIVRIACLLVTGAVLYGAGLLMRRIADWGRTG